jgi:hypothetical protein
MTAPLGSWNVAVGGGEVAERIFRRLITGVEAVIYGPPSLVSGWFRDDTGFGGHDPLATDPPPALDDFVL